MSKDYEEHRWQIEVAQAVLNLPAFSVVDLPGISLLRVPSGFVCMSHCPGAASTACFIPEPTSEQVQSWWLAVGRIPGWGGCPKAVEGEE